MTPAKLPSPQDLQSALRVYAALDIIMSPNFNSRYYSYDPNWGDNEVLANIDNGSGDHIFFVFSEAGCFIKGLDHETRDPDRHEATYFEGVPDALKHNVDEPAFVNDFVSYCLWRVPGDTGWQMAIQPEDLPEDTFYVLKYAAPTPKAYLDYTAWYWEKPLTTDLLAPLFSGAPMTAELARSFNPDVDYLAAMKELKEMGFECEV